MSNFLEFKDITMLFPGVKALSEVSLGIDRGEIVAFLGENGAGKSTLLKILSGDYQATEGSIFIDGVEKHFPTPNAAIKDGVSVIYQERQLAEYLSVAENIFMGNTPTTGGFINFKQLNAAAKEIIAEFDLPIDPTTPIRKISVAYQQMVEIMKAYSRKADIYCFDEPTAPLTENEIGSLFKIIRKLKEENKCIIYVSHRINEIFEITDRVAVLKDGELVSVVNTCDTNEQELVKMMVGRDLGDVYNNLNRNSNFGDEVLCLKGVTNHNIEDVSFSIKSGEILGIAGIAGAGRTETARVIFGADPMESGEMTLNGNNYRPSSPRDAMSKGVALAPEDRKDEGLSLIRPVRENISLAVLDRFIKFGFINRKEETDFANNAVDVFNIKTPSIEQKIIYLSGGNQQKVILARWMAMDPDVIIFDEPTKGIDVGSKSEIYQMICNAASKGLAVILISSELTEIIGLSDRVLVMKDGKIKVELTGDKITEDAILSYAIIENIS